MALPVADVILQFTIVVAAALVVRLTLERSQIPGIVGLLVLGMLAGPGGLAILPEEPVVELLGSVGLLYIMFMAGLEIDMDVVRHHKRETGGFGLLAFALTLIPAIAVGLIAGLEWGGALLLGAALSSHTLLSYPIVERLGLVRRRAVVAAIGGTLLTDTLALTLLVIVIQQAGQGQDGVAAAFGWYGPILLLAGLVAASLALIPRLAGRVLAAGTRPADKALFVLAVLLLLSAAADAVGTEDILGAFLAGICLNRAVRHRAELQENVEFVGRMLFIPFFYVDTGMRLELAVFAERLETWVLAAALLGVVLAGKSGAAWIAGRAFHYSPTERVTVASLTFPQAAATLAVVVTGREAGLLGEEVVDAIIIVIFLTCLLGPLVTSRAGQRLARQQPGR